MSEEHFQIAAGRPGRPVDAAIEAFAAEERARGWRGSLTALAAGLSAPLWVCAVWPRSIAGGLRVTVEALWALAAAGAIAALVSERIWRHRRSGRVAALGPLPRLRAERAAVANAAACAESDRAED